MLKTKIWLKGLINILGILGGLFIFGGLYLVAKNTEVSIREIKQTSKETDAKVDLLVKAIKKDSIQIQSLQFHEDSTETRKLK